MSKLRKRDSLTKYEHCVKEGVVKFKRHPIEIVNAKASRRAYRAFLGGIV